MARLASALGSGVREEGDPGAEPPVGGGGALLALSTLVRLAAAATLPLLAAETYYWGWSLHLSPGYVDHPPAIAALIAAGTALAGQGALGLRLGPVLLGTLGLGIFLRWCREMIGARAAWTATLFLALAPFFLPLTTLALPDAPLLVCWIASLASFWSAYRRGGAWRWLLVGLATGAALWSKYNAFQLPLVYFVFLLLAPGGREILRRPAPWGALALALGLAAPNVLWNAAHGGSTFATPFQEGLDLAHLLANVASLPADVLLLLTPVVAVLWAARTLALLRSGAWRRDERALFCCCASLLPLACFAGVSVLTQVHLHWIATALLAATPIAFGRFGADEPPGQSLVRPGLLVAGVLMALLLAAPPLLARSSWVAGENAPRALEKLSQELRGRDELRVRLDQEIARLGGERLLLMARDYHEASLLRWLSGNRLPTLPLDRSRFRQYVHDYQDGSHDGWSALYVDKYGKASTTSLLLRAFAEVERLAPLEVFVDGRLARRYELYQARGFRGPLAHTGHERDEDAAPDAEP